MSTIGISHLAYRLPDQRLSLENAAQRGLFASEASFLRDIGFEYCFVEDDPVVHDDMIVECGQDLLTRSALRRDEVGWLFRCSGISNELPHPRKGDILAQFRYPVGRSQQRLDLQRASGMALSQQGCSGLLSSLHIANQLLRADGADAVMCLAGDVFPRGGTREILYNVMSDAAGAVLVQKNAAKNRILHFEQHSMPYYWDTPHHTTEMLASYFPLAQRVILGTLDAAGVAPGDLAWVVPHNVSLRSWTILSELVGIPSTRIWTDNIARVGHTISCDHIINLYDMEQQGVLRSGDLLLLFTFGFGATWTCLLIEH